MQPVMPRGPAGKIQQRLLLAFPGAFLDGFQQWTQEEFNQPARPSLDLSRHGHAGRQVASPVSI